MLNPKALTLAVILGVLSPIVPINVLSESHVLAQTQEERKAEADRLLQQGQSGEFQAALQSFLQALKIYQEIGNRSGEANSLNSLGNAYHSLGQYQTVIEYYENGTVVWVDSETGLPMNISSNLSHPYYWAAFILIGNGL